MSRIDGESSFYIFFYIFHRTTFEERRLKSKFTLFTFLIPKFVKEHIPVIDEESSTYIFFYIFIARFSKRED